MKSSPLSRWANPFAWWLVFTLSRIASRLREVSAPHPAPEGRCFLSRRDESEKCVRICEHVDVKRWHSVALGMKVKLPNQLISLLRSRIEDYWPILSSQLLTEGS